MYVIDAGFCELKGFRGGHTFFVGDSHPDEEGSSEEGRFLDYDCDDRVRSRICRYRH